MQDPIHCSLLRFNFQKDYRSSANCEGNKGPRVAPRGLDLGQLIQKSETLCKKRPGGDRVFVELKLNMRFLPIDPFQQVAED